MDGHATPDDSPRSALAGGTRLVWLVVAIAALLPHGLAISFLNDDAFISFRYAKNWVAGHGLVFNPGERVEGYTNFLWTMLLGVFWRFGGDPLVVSRVLGFLASAGTLIVTARLAARLARARGDAPGSTLFAGIAPLLLAAWTPFAYWTFAGLEGPLFTFLLALVIDREVALVAGAGAGAGSAPPASASRRGSIVTGVLLALLALTRPEGVMFFAIVFGARVLTNRPAGLVRAALAQAPLAAAFAAVYAPYFLWRFLYYGFLLPNTYYLRQGTTAAENLSLYGNGAAYLFSFLREGGGVILLAPLLLFVRRPLGRAVRLLGAVTGIVLVYLVGVGGDAKILFRFLVPILPLVCVLAEETLAVIAGALARDDTHAGARRGVPLVTRAAAGALVVGLAAHLAAPSFSPPEKYRIDKTFFAMLAEGGKWIARYAPPNSTVACFAVGALPYYAGVPCYDLLGVTDARIAHGRLKPGEMTGHGKTDIRYILEKRPTFIFSMEGADFASEGYEYAPISVRVGDQVLSLRAWRLRG
ncbi:MAG: hypothetical protein ACKVU1_01970 [bacterium]